ncbi:hypothetical protein [Phaeobacter gallaeciensis]|uniref:hypothetical protein n=1 Tax=Phaeobacter gallaeciensis TaxID=60890 RepID=UPI0011E4CB45|nr:hypothetical protein [Phaeobacter gallaeciensis]
MGRWYLPRSCAVFVTDAAAITGDLTVQTLAGQKAQPEQQSGQAAAVAQPGAASATCSLPLLPKPATFMPPSRII